MPETADLIGTPITVPTVDAPTETKPAKPAGRPTTRAGRRAASEAAKAAKRTETAPRATAPTKTDVKQSIATLHEYAGAGLGLVGMPITGAAMTASAADAGEAWAAVCKRYPQVERFFGAGTDGLVLFKLAMVYAPIIMTAVAESSQPKDESSPLADAMAMFSAQPEQPAPRDGQNTGGRP